MVVSALRRAMSHFDDGVHKEIKFVLILKFIFIDEIFVDRFSLVNFWFLRPRNIWMSSFFVLEIGKF